MIQGSIIKIAGPVMIAEGMTGTQVGELVLVGDQQLLGEIIELKKDTAIIQVYEETGGLRPGEPVTSTGEQLSVELGPGIMTTIYDGIQRPLKTIREQTGTFITRGIDIPSLDREKKWEFEPLVQEGQIVTGGDFLGQVQETDLVLHKVMVPPGVEGKVIQIVPAGNYTVTETIAVVKTAQGEEKSLQMMHKWPVRIARPYQVKQDPDEPLLTGQRILDTFFPITKGGTAAIPGPFGAGKTVTQQQVTKWCDAQIIIYVGCGERGNEMTEVLEEFPRLLDAHSGKSLMERTVLIANTSNMPVVARDASVYTGITLGEYYRDMGYSVALMADSTSRWAEAMREISGRLEEMPGEEGYPAYLASRLASFYERAGKVTTLGTEGRTAALSVIGAVSPPGGDFSEPVTQNTLRIVKVFWALDAPLAHQRHFPAIHWLKSYSLYLEKMGFWWTSQVEPSFNELRVQAMTLLQKEEELKEIVQLVGPDAIADHERIILEAAKIIREDFLQQNAYDDVDSYCSAKKQAMMLRLFLKFYHDINEVVSKGVSPKAIAKLPVKDDFARLKYVPENQVPGTVDDINNRMAQQLRELTLKTSKE